MLPNFIIVGAAKCGTTSIDKYLRQHPEVYMCPQKEPDFFSFIGQKIDFKGPHDQGMKDIIVTDFEKYKSFFENITTQTAIGECSNSYLYFTHTAKNIRKSIPDCKIIIVLRDPVERAFSHYAQHVMLGHENLSFEEAIEQETERQKSSWRWYYQYTGQSLYYQQVKTYFEVFPKEQILVTFFDDLKRDPRTFMNGIFLFIGVKEDTGFIKYKIYNKTGMPKSRTFYNFIHNKHHPLKKIAKKLTSKKVRAQLYNFLYEINMDYKSKPKLAETTEKKLRSYFKEDVQKLEKLVQRDLSIWCEN